MAIEVPTPSSKFDKELRYILENHRTIINNDEWITISGKDFGLICCDCGLAHRCTIKIINKNTIKLRANRDERATQILREMKENGHNNSKAE